MLQFYSRTVVRSEQCVHKNSSGKRRGAEHVLRKLKMYAKEGHTSSSPSSRQMLLAKQDTAESHLTTVQVIPSRGPVEHDISVRTRQSQSNAGRRQRSLQRFVKKLVQLTDCCVVLNK